MEAVYPRLVESSILRSTGPSDGLFVLNGPFPLQRMIPATLIAVGIFRITG